MPFLNLWAKICNRRLYGCMSLRWKTNKLLILCCVNQYITSICIYKISLRIDKRRLLINPQLQTNFNFTIEYTCTVSFKEFL